MLREQRLFERFARLAIVVVCWLVLFVLWLASTVWIISPLLWKQVNWDDIFVLIGRSLTLSFLVTVSCAVLGIFQIPLKSLKQLRWLDTISIIELIWKFSGIYFAILFLSASIFLMYWILTKP